MEERKEEDAYLVTGNIRHFPEKPYVVTPRQMLNIILEDALGEISDRERAYLHYRFGFLDYVLHDQSETASRPYWNPRAKGCVSPVGSVSASKRFAF